MRKDAAVSKQMLGAGYWMLDAIKLESLEARKQGGEKPGGWKAIIG
ncbi:MAG: hypothetical protein PVJ77_26280 [Desulfobacterales bacterium]